MLYPLLTLGYLTIGFFRTQHATVDRIIHPGPVRPGFTNEPLTHIPFWPLGIVGLIAEKVRK